MKVSPDILKGKRRIHFIGIGGSGMFPLAQIMLKQGYEVTGSDNNPGDTIEQEREMGMRVTLSQKAENIQGADLIIYTAAILPDNPELIAAKQGEAPAIERSQLLGLVSSQYNNCIAVAGTHGKTTTTAMLTHVLLENGIDPSAVIGGKLKEIGGSGLVGDSDVLVVEACEFVDTFLELDPNVAVILNVDADHLDYFKTLDNIIRSFNVFARMATHTVIANGDDENSKKAVAGVERPVITFGLAEGNDFRAVNTQKSALSVGYVFDVMHKGEKIASVETGVPGEHNIYNSLAALICAVRAGVDPQAAANSITTFCGAGRRFEIMGINRGVTIADDYAHHPKEIEATIKSAKTMGFNEVWAVHQPFTYSRTSMLMDDFAKALSLADHVVLSEIMGGREHNTYNVFANDLCERIDGGRWFPEFPEIAAYVMENAKEGDLVITLGCGDVYKCAKLMLREKK